MIKTNYATETSTICKKDNFHQNISQKTSIKYQINAQSSKIQKKTIKSRIFNIFIQKFNYFKRKQVQKPVQSNRKYDQTTIQQLQIKPKPKNKGIQLNIQNQNWNKQININKCQHSIGAPQYIKNNILKPSLSRIRNYFLQKCQICEAKHLKRRLMGFTECQHKYCQNCITNYIKTKIQLFQVILCPQCNSHINKNSQIYKKLTDKQKKKYQKIQIVQSIKYNKYLKLCPTTNCLGIINFQSSQSSIQNQNKFKCTVCNKIFCQCLLEKHDGPCDNNLTKKLVYKFGFKECIKCKQIIQKLSGCNHITCQCGYQFCYVCGKAWIGLSHICQLQNINLQNSQNPEQQNEDLNQSCGMRTIIIAISRVFFYFILFAILLLFWFGIMITSIGILFTFGLLYTIFLVFNNILSKIKDENCMKSFFSTLLTIVFLPICYIYFFSQFIITDFITYVNIMGIAICQFNGSIVSKTVNFFG